MTSQCRPGNHSHNDYGGGRCHPTAQQHRDGIGPKADGKTKSESKAQSGPVRAEPTKVAGPSDTQARVQEIVENRHAIGRPGKFIRRLGEIGEKVVASVMTEYKAHETWNAANDLSNHANIEIKLVSPNSRGTPIMPNAHRRKVDMAIESNKRFKFVIIRPTDESLEVFELDEPPDFRHAPDEAYILDLEKFSKVGHFELNGEFRRANK